MTKFKIPAFIPPTESELVETSKRWWEQQKGINFRDWNNNLVYNSYPFELIKLDKDIIQEIINLYDGKADLYALEKHFESLLVGRINNFENGFFIKLISRSPKDFLYDENNFGKPKPLFTWKEATDAITASLRCFEDIVYFKYIPDECYLVIRPYIDFHPSQEWRVMVYGKQIVGISQYYYENDFNYTPAHISDVEFNIREFIDNIVSINMEINHFVADVVVSNGTVKLLETNPYGMSDPCLFKNYGNLDGTLKYFK